ncbi:hypothetical protein F5146DRAFT_1054738 [Armillaria mellea]|nr:hypothetical protein F5146DRAFT_1054738 [Armillaria mellea]
MVERPVAGDTPDGPMHAQPMDEDGNYKTGILTRFHKQWKTSRHEGSIFFELTEMQNRVSTNPVDRVAGLAFRLGSNTLPAYYERNSLEDAWTALVDSMVSWMRGTFLFKYPEVGQGFKKWRPTWEQVMTKSLPVTSDCHEYVHRGEEMDEDWHDGPCIEKGFVHGLAVESASLVDRRGELVVEDVHGTIHRFKLVAAHQFPIREETYMLLGTRPWSPDGILRDPQYWTVGRWLPAKGFEKISVVSITDVDEIERLKNLGLTKVSRILVL